MNFEDARPRRKISGLADLIRGTIEAVFRESLNDYTYGLRGQVSLAHPFGTHFTMTHDPNAGYVSVSVKEGEVVLSSPHDSRIIKAGQTAATVNGKFLDKPVL